MDYVLLIYRRAFSLLNAVTADMYLVAGIDAPTVPQISNVCRLQANVAIYHSIMNVV